jgi:hypothetical protein
MTDSSGPTTLGIPPGELDEIPVEELIRITREFTRRITNQDRQRESLGLRESGHQRTIQTSAPITLQQFFSGEIDLDTDLARRFSNAPLLSHGRFLPGPGEPVRRQASAMLSSNDDSATVGVDAPLPRGTQAALEVTFTLFGALALRFRLPLLEAPDRTRWLDLMRRDNGIAFLWTRQRWEQPYLIFVVRERFARLYAFSPQGFEAAARMTPDVTEGLIGWLEGLWFPDRQPKPAPAGAVTKPAAATGINAPELEARGWERVPTQIRRPERGTPTLRSDIPDEPEEQWDDALPDVQDDGPLFDEASLGDAPLDGAPFQDVDEDDLAASDLEW